MTETPGWMPISNCPNGPHRGPEGPCEDIGVCPVCWLPMGVMRPAGETIGFHADDCSLPERHPGCCVGGGEGHPPAETIRGYWQGYEADVAAARERWAARPTQADDAERSGR